MKNQRITAHVKMDYKTLRAFSLFDTFFLRKGWIRPTIFGDAFVLFALICFLATGKEQNWLLGIVLLVIGVGMPTVYVGMFLSGVKARAKKLRLDPPRPVYTLNLSDSSVTIHNDMKQEPDVELPWQKIPAAFRVKNAVYLYATPAKAFILPDGQADASPADVWAFIASHLPEGRANVRKKK